MQWRITVNLLTDPSNHWTKQNNPLAASSEEAQQIVVNANSEEQAREIFFTMVNQYGIKVADYHIEQIIKPNPHNDQNQ